MVDVTEMVKVKLIPIRFARIIHGSFSRNSRKENALTFDRDLAARQISALFGKPLSDILRLAGRTDLDYLAIWIESEVSTVTLVVRIFFATHVDAIVPERGIEGLGC